MKNFKFKISNFNKYLIFCIGILFVYLFYLSIPTIYNKDILQKELSEKILSNYNLNISLSSEIDYLILPSPHFLIRNAKLFNDSDAISEELGQIKKLKVFISKKSLMRQKHMRITKLLIKDANFSITNDNLNFYYRYINKKLSKNPLEIKNSNFFFKDKTDETISILFIPKLDLFFEKEKKINKLSGNGEIFQIPISFKWKKEFNENNVKSFLFNIEPLSLNFENKSITSKNNGGKGENIINIGNAKLITNYLFKENSILLESLNSKVFNNVIKYDGKINIKPFFINLNLNLEKINLQKILFQKPIIKEILFSKIIFDENLSAKINIVSKNIKNKLFDSINLNLNIDGGSINLNETILLNEKVGKLNLKNSSFLFENDELIFNGYFNFEIKNQYEFYRAFVVPKRNRKFLENIDFNIEYNLLKNQLKIIDITVNDKTTDNIDNIEEILKTHNTQDKLQITNWIDLKNFVNKIFDNYFG
tara:strand:+ start:557 stop:1990 length:1434 start_codon:yes stop_codon:yes gene_type:complete